MAQDEKQFKAGFNHGYLLAKYEPELASIVVKNIPIEKLTTDYRIGFGCGHDVYFVKEMINHNAKEQGKASPYNGKEYKSLNTSEKQFTRGFNHGYALAKHEPELAKTIVKSAGKNESHYFKGIISGKQEYNIEKIRQRLKGVSKNNDQSKSVEKSKGRKK